MKTRKKERKGQWIRTRKRLAIYHRDNCRCVYCGKECAQEELTLDHVTPIALGGTNCHSNLVTACMSCNTSKGKKSVRSFLKYLREEKNIDTAKIPPRVRRQTKKELIGYRKLT